MFMCTLLPIHFPAKNTTGVGGIFCHLFLQIMLPLRPQTYQIVCAHTNYDISLHSALNHHNNLPHKQLFWFCINARAACIFSILLICSAHPTTN